MGNRRLQDREGRRESHQDPKSVEGGPQISNYSLEEACRSHEGRVSEASQEACLLRGKEEPQGSGFVK